MMVKIVYLKGKDVLPDDEDYLVIRCLSRSRAVEFFVASSRSLQQKIGARTPPIEPGFASLEGALTEAQAVAARQNVPTIYVQQSSIYVRPLGTLFRL